MLLLYSMYSFYFTFLDSVKAIMVHCAHRLLSGLNLMLCTLRTRPLARAFRSRCQPRRKSESLDCKFHHRMNFPCSVAGKMASPVRSLIFERITDIEERFAG